LLKEIYININNLVIKIKISVVIFTVILLIFSIAKNNYGIIYFLGLLSIICIHELGHFFAAKLFKLKTLEIHISPLIGLCYIEECYNHFHELIVYSSGIFLQLLIFIIGIISINTINNQTNEFYWFANYIMVFINAGIIIFNLLPFEPLDGFYIFKNLRWLINNKIRFFHKSKNYKNKHNPSNKIDKNQQISKLLKEIKSKNIESYSKK